MTDTIAVCAHLMLRYHPLPAGTDPHTQGEMLAWLHQNYGSVEIHCDATGYVEAYSRALDAGGNFATINEALARLVVAVAEREAGR